MLSNWNVLYFVLFQTKYKSTSKSSHDLLNDPKLLKDVGLDLDKDDYIEEPSAQTAASTSKPVEIDTIRNKLSKKEKSKPKMAEKSEEDMTDNEKRAKVLREIKALKKDLKSDKSSSAVDEVSAGDESAKNKGTKRALTEEEEANDLLVSLEEEKVK